VKLILCVVPLLALLVPSVAFGQTAPANAPTLTIKEGTFKDTKNKEVSGSAPVAAGARIWITANDAAPDKIFDTWTGDTQGLSKQGLTEARTLLTMPATNATLTATYKDYKSLRIACIGETSTDMTNYPRDLGKLLNAAHDADKNAPLYDVRNYGVPDSTIVQTEKPWSKTAKHDQAKAFTPHVVIFIFGPQDCQKGKNLNANATFVPEYEKLVAEFAALPTKPKIFICIPPAIAGAGNWGMTNDNMQQKIVPGIKTTAQDENATLIDLAPAFEGHPELIHDAVHLVGDSHKVIADAVYKAILGNTNAAAPSTASAPARQQ
jgi:acyl-CoA thioesterase I